MSIKSKWLKALFLGMMAMASFAGGPMNPKEIEDLLHVMNETKVEFTIPDESEKGEGNRPWILRTAQNEEEIECGSSTAKAKADSSLCSE